MSLTCAVTGARGYVGSHIAQKLEQAGHKVLRLGRDSQRDDRLFILGEPVKPMLLEGVDVLIHCAYDRRAWRADQDHQLNVVGSARLLRAATQASVSRVIFISSVSAFEGCRSFYGQGKLAVEGLVRDIGGIIFRPGLVYGDPGRGMFGALSRMARLPVLPVFDGGRQPFVLVHADDLANAVVEALNWSLPFVGGPVVLAHPDRVTFLDILRIAAVHHGHRLKTVSIPGWLGVFLLRTLEALRMNPGFRSDGLVSLLNSNPGLEVAIAEKLGLHFRRFLDSDPSLL